MGMVMDSLGGVPTEGKHDRDLHRFMGFVVHALNDSGWNMLPPNCPLLLDWNLLLYREVDNRMHVDRTQLGYLKQHSCYHATSSAYRRGIMTPAGSTCSVHNVGRHLTREHRQCWWS